MELKLLLWLIIGCTFSCWALRFEFQQNSKMATTMAIAKPHSRTTNTPPVTWLQVSQMTNRSYRQRNAGTKFG